MMKKSILPFLMLFMFFAPAGAFSDDLESLRERVEKLEERVRAEDERALRPYWDGRLRLKTDDGRFNVQLRGRLHYDIMFWAHEPSAITRQIGRLPDVTQFRRARLGTAGTLWGNTDYIAEWDFADSSADIRDGYLQISGSGAMGSFRAGHFKEPFSLEELTSSNNITFMERSLPTAFAPGFNYGFMLHNRIMDGRMTWAAALHDQSRLSTHGDWATTARITGTPYYAGEGSRLVHPGAAASVRRSGGREIRYNARPEIRTEGIPRFADTGGLEQS